MPTQPSDPRGPHTQKGRALADASGAGVNGGNRWFPSKQQLDTPESIERSFRQILTQHYDLQDKYDALSSSHAQLQSDHADVKQQLADAHAKVASAQGPSTTKLLGLHVAPVDTSTLANGATLKFSKANGNFIFS